MTQTSWAAWTGAAVHRKLDWYVPQRTQHRDRAAAAWETCTDSLTVVKPTEDDSTGKFFPSLAETCPQYAHAPCFSGHTSWFCNGCSVETFRPQSRTFLNWDKRGTLSFTHSSLAAKSIISRFDQMSNQWSAPCDRGPACAQLQKKKC